MDPESIKQLVNTVKYPLVIKNNCNWPLLNMSLDDWVSHLGENKLLFRQKPVKISAEPCWERYCPTEMMTFKEFIEKRSFSSDWFYYDYVNLSSSPVTDIFKINWEAFGFPDKGIEDSTLWIGSEGAHTPCHQDTYGFNIVLQIYGRKRWLLFPPESANVMPTRIPYEESSVYSKLNFYYPINLDSFKDLSGCRMVTLEPGDALVVPHRWWHYVEHVSPIGITINTWIPCDLDVERRVEESITRTIISQFSKDLPEECLLLLLNPNEEDVLELSLNSNFKLLETTLEKCIEHRHKHCGIKKLKPIDSHQPLSECSTSEFDVNKFISCNHNIEIVKEISNEDFINILKENIQKHKNSSCDVPDKENPVADDYVFCRILRSICQSNVINEIKHNLLNEHVTLMPSNK